MRSCPNVIRGPWPAACLLLVLCGAARSATFDPTENYEVRQVEGWTVRVNKRLLADESLCQRTMALLGDQLRHIVRVVPPGPLGGCMAECGSGSGMAAAALVGLAGGNLDQQIAAASLALQNTFGMICDPIGNRVEAPCLGKNVMGAVNALACANMALAGYRHLIPLDEVIEAMNRVGKSIPRDLRCTGLGGLSITPSAKRIQEALGKAT